MGSRPASRQVSCDISRDTAELPEFKPSSSFKSKLKSHDSGIFEKVNLSLSRLVFDQGVDFRTAKRLVSVKLDFLCGRRCTDSDPRLMFSLLFPQTSYDTDVAAPAGVRERSSISNVSEIRLSAGLQPSPTMKISSDVTSA